MKFKVIEAYDAEELETKVQKFINTENLINTTVISVNIWYDPESKTNCAGIMYRE